MAKKLIICFVIAALASASAFVVHVITVEWLPNWIGSQMADKQVSPSWNVRYTAMITSIEYGIACLFLYHLLREKIIIKGKCIAILILFALLTALHGALLRQPLMDFIIGNPLQVVLVQNGFKYLVWLLMSFVTVLAYERFLKD
ncbi:hypothetical protein [uncultured Pseudoteredinibacter sp.]|uniref:hypothetical protein n=1 Tax=uncultured Pseudoteredinibacter sp. TaxID=1641701 RepID=UPI002639EB61|nr:hypothetical protein [uncultured Pseudoteredinibacter sp.]